MVITIAGNNLYACSQRLHELVSKFISDHGELAVERIDAEEKDVAAIKDAVQGVGFLTSNKLVVLRGLSLNKQAVEQVEQILSSIPETTDVVIYEPITDKRTGFYKFLKAHTQFEEYQELDENHLASWLVEQAKRSSAVLSHSDARYMVERVGVGQQRLASELEKLILYDISISRDTIELLVPATPQGKIFELLDAAFAGRKQKALELYTDQRAQNVEPQAIAAMLAWQLQIMALAKFGGKKPSGEIAKDAGVSPYPLSKASGMVSRMPLEQLKQMINDLTLIDYKSKTSKFDLDEALKTYIVSL